MFFGIALVFGTIVSIPLFDGVRAFLENLFQKSGRGILRPVRHNRRVKLSRKVIYSHVQRFRFPWVVSPTILGKLCVVGMDHFSRIALVVALGFLFQFFLDLFLDLRQSLQAILQTSVPLIDTLVNTEIIDSGSIDYIIDCVFRLVWYSLDKTDILIPSLKYLSAISRLLTGVSLVHL